MQNNNAKNLIIDCDGVLYPLKELSTADIVNAMKAVYRDEVGLSGDEQKFVSEKTIREGHLGMFNYIKEICYFKKYDFDKFCASVAERIDYSGINRNKKLWQALYNTAKNHNINIFTNNSRPHLEKVLNRVFEKSIADLEASGIKIYDIKATEKDGYFYPKQHEKGFSMFMSKLNISSSESILFDDAPRNIEKAKEAGMQGVLITEENTLLKELNKINGNIVRKSRAYE